MLLINWVSGLIETLNQVGCRIKCVRTPSSKGTSMLYCILIVLLSPNGTTYEACYRFWYEFPWVISFYVIILLSERLCHYFVICFQHPTESISETGETSNYQQLWGITEDSRKPRQMAVQTLLSWMRLRRHDIHCTMRLRAAASRVDVVW